MVMDEFVRWLGKQFDEDERICRGPLWDDDASLGSGRWHAYDRGGPSQHWGRVRWVVIDGADEGVVDSQPQAADDEGVARHIAEWDPSRVLRETAAKRQIVRWHHRRPAPKWDLDGVEGFECATCDQQFPCKTLRLLTLPYTDRPGFKEEWRP